MPAPPITVAASSTPAIVPPIFRVPKLPKYSASTKVPAPTVDMPPLSRSRVPVPFWPTMIFPMLAILLAVPSTVSAALVAGATLSIRIPLVWEIAPPPETCRVPELTVITPV